MPLVSVIVPSYNHQQYIEECLLSVINQTYINIQLIVIDDGSTDESVKIIQRLKEIYGFTFIAQSNIGLSATLNKAISNYVKGDYVAILASDDYWHTAKIAQQVGFFSRESSYAMIFSNAALVNGNSQVTGCFDRKRFSVTSSFGNLFTNKTGIPALTTLIKTSIFKTVGLFDEKLLIEDWDMWLRIAHHYKIGYQDEVLAYYRFHGNNISSQTELMLQNRFQIIEKWKKIEPSLHQASLAYWQLYGLKSLMKQKQLVPEFYLHPVKLNRYHIKYIYYKLKYRLKNI